MMFNFFRQVLTFKADTSNFRFDYSEQDEEDIIQLPPPPRQEYRSKRTRGNTVVVVMNANVQEPSRKEVVVANKHTGFPEPFSENRNTTLPHPEADTSPNATIEAPDFDLTRTHSRSSIFDRKHHRHHLWGKHDTPEKMGLCDDITCAEDEVPVGVETVEEAEKQKSSDVVEGERKKGVLKKLVRKS